MVGTWWEHDPFLMGLPVWGEGGDLSEREGGNIYGYHEHLLIRAGGLKGVGAEGGAWWL